jgi:hypothetical protein
LAGKKKQTGRAAVTPVGIGFGVISALFITVLGAVGLTALIAGEHMSVATFGYGVMVILLVAAVVGAGVAMLLVKHRKLLISLLTGAAYYLVLLSLNAMFFGGQYEGALTTGLLILGGSGVAAIIGSREGKPLKRKHKILAYR